jgi:hypothetical protein
MLLLLSQSHFDAQLRTGFLNSSYSHVLFHYSLYYRQSDYRP